MYWAARWFDVVIFTLAFFAPKGAKMPSFGTYTVMLKAGTPSGSGSGRRGDPTKWSDRRPWRAFDAGGLVHYGAAASNDR